MPSPTTDRLELPDVNVLVALLHPNHVHHTLASAWLDRAGRFATTPVTESGFVRISLNAAVVGPAAAVPHAVLVSLASIRAEPRWSFLPDDSTLADPRIDLAGLAGHRQVTDLHLVNLAARHHAVLVTFDRRLPAALLGRDRDRVRLIG